MKGIAARMRDQPPYFTQSVYVKDLVVSDSPRLNGVDEAHARRLADVYHSLPPILVHTPSMRVIDGMHRVRAAVILGLETIDAQFFDGSDDEAFIQSVARNIADGLLLSPADRSAAVRRILTGFPAMSDPSIAVYTGLDTGTVSEVRRRAAARSSELGHSGTGDRPAAADAAVCGQATELVSRTSGGPLNPGVRAAAELSPDAARSAGSARSGTRRSRRPVPSRRARSRRGCPRPGAPRRAGAGP